MIQTSLGVGRREPFEYGPPRQAVDWKKRTRLAGLRPRTWPVTLGVMQLSPSRTPASTPPSVMMYRVTRAPDVPFVVLPRVEVQLMVRRGAMADGGLDIHVMGGLPSVRRKMPRDPMEVVSARMDFDVVARVLGASACEFTGRVVDLEALWGAELVRRLRERLWAAPDDATRIVEEALSQRLRTPPRDLANVRMVQRARARLPHATVSAVASELGVSERHLRRVFRATIGMGPQTVAKLARFRRAMSTAHARTSVNWASVATDAGYYDQAHLIAECRSIAGVTPRVLLGELRQAYPQASLRHPRSDGVRHAQP